MIKSSEEPLNLVWLTTIVAEMCILLAREHWCYNEPVDISIEAVRLKARELAGNMYDGFKDDGRYGGFGSVQ